MFARRGYNVQSLAVGPSERTGMSRITMVVPGSPSGIANLLKQVRMFLVVSLFVCDGGALLLSSLLAEYG